MLCLLLSIFHKWQSTNRGEYFLQRNVIFIFNDRNTLKRMLIIQYSFRFRFRLQHSNQSISHQWLAFMILENFLQRFNIPTPTRSSPLSKLHGTRFKFQDERFRAKSIEGNQQTKEDANEISHEIAGNSMINVVPFPLTESFT